MRLKLKYPFDWGGLEDFSSYAFDVHGVPQVDYGADIGLRYNAITVSQYGLYRLQQFADNGSEEHLARAMACADWLLAHAQIWDKDILAWIYEYDLPFYGPKAPWISAMAQGEGVSLLIRCHVLQKKPAYLEVARAAIKALELPVAEGGVLDFLSDGSSWFEEYPTRPASHVFNGHVFALLGVVDCADYLDLPDYWALYQRGISSIETNWRLWDRGFWTRYDLHRSNRLASHMYQKVHIRLMTLLAYRTARPVFYSVARRWRKMLHDPWCNIIWLLMKSKEKLLQRRTWL